MTGAASRSRCIAVEDRDADGVPVRVYRPSADTNLPILVVFHGGGWVIGSVEQYDPIARWLANASGAVVVSVDYRLAPEHPYPAPLDDCWTALRWAAAHASEIGGDASRIAVGGDSAGGNLAAVCALLARDAGGPALALQALVYPVCRRRFRDRVVRRQRRGLPARPRPDAVVLRLLHDRARRSRPTGTSRRSARADLAGVAPAVVLTAEYDPLRDEGKAYADRLRDAGVAVEYRCFEGMIHSFFGLAAYDAAATRWTSWRPSCGGRSVRSTPDMAVIDVAGFVADLKDHAVEHRFHVHDERHFVESYSLRQTWEVDLHPEEGCEGPVDLYLSLEIDPRVLLGLRGRGDRARRRERPRRRLPLPAQLHVGAAAAAARTRSARPGDRAGGRRRAGAAGRGVGHRLLPVGHRRPRAHACASSPIRRSRSSAFAAVRKCRATRSRAAWASAGSCSSTPPTGSAESARMVP